MWSDLTKIGGVTNSVTLPNDGIVSVVIPSGVELCAYINGIEAPMHHLHVRAGDNLSFKLNSHSNIPANIQVNYDNTMHNLAVVPDIMHKEDSVIPYKPEHVEYMPTQGTEIMTPAETINLFANPGMGGMGGAGAGAGAGLGAGLLGGILGGALLGGNRGGLLNNGGTDIVNTQGVVTPALLASSLAQVTDTAQSTTVLQTLGDIKASIPLAEGQVQLALAGAQADINGNISMGLQTAINGQAGINANIANAIATSLASQAAIKETVLSSAAANLTATLNSKFEIANTIRDDGDKTRALIVAQNDAMLNRQLTVAEAALLEQRAIGRSREVEVNVTQTVNQNQLQLQAQQQQQQQLLILSQVASALNGLQNAVATNSNLIVGNTGAVATGPQTANPVNVRT